jgi:molybdopterin converting factor small subunit
MIEIRVKFFASAQDAVGKSEHVFTVADDQFEESDAAQGISVETFKRDYLLKEYPELASVLSTSLLAVDLQYLYNTDSIRLTKSCEIAIIPPISGG